MKLYKTGNKQMIKNIEVGDKIVVLDVNHYREGDPTPLGNFPNTHAGRIVTITTVVTKGNGNPQGYHADELGGYTVPLSLAQLYVKGNGKSVKSKKKSFLARIKPFKSKEGEPIKVLLTISSTLQAHIRRISVTDETTDFEIGKKSYTRYLGLRAITSSMSSGEYAIFIKELVDNRKATFEFESYSRYDNFKYYLNNACNRVMKTEGNNTVIEMRSY